MIIMEIQIKTTPITMANLKRLAIPNVGEGLEELKPSYNAN